MGADKRWHLQQSIDQSRRASSIHSLPVAAFLVIRLVSPVPLVFIPSVHVFLAHYGLRLLDPFLSGMMALKRKPNPYVHDSTDILGRKRSKRSYTVISSSESGTDDGSAENSDIGEDEWLIKCILDENESQYLIDWDGPWSPTWVSCDLSRRALNARGFEGRGLVGVRPSRALTVLRSPRRTRTTSPFKSGTKRRKLAVPRRYSNLPKT